MSDKITYLKVGWKALILGIEVTISLTNQTIIVVVIMHNSVTNKTKTSAEIEA